MCSDAPEVGSKLCHKCGQTKPRNAFSICRGRPDGLQTACKACKAHYHVGYARANAQHLKTKRRRGHLQRAYGITEADYARMLAEQAGKCAICGTSSPGGRYPDRFSVDHDHATGKVRALLCVDCNSALGRFHDDAERMRRAADYVEAHRAN